MKQMGMDRKIEKKKWTQKKSYYLIGSIVGVVMLFFLFKAISVFIVSGVSVFYFICCLRFWGNEQRGGSVANDVPDF